MKNNAWIEVLQGRILTILVVIVVVLGVIVFTQHAREIQREARGTGLEIIPITVEEIPAESLCGRLVIGGGMSIGESFEPIHNAANVMKLDVEKGAQTILFSVCTRAS